MTKNSFEFFEMVRIVSPSSSLKLINNELAAILGMALGDDEQWTYAVHVYSQGKVWSCNEEDLVSTGKFDSRETFYTGHSIRVSRDGDIL